MRSQQCSKLSRHYKQDEMTIQRKPRPVSVGVFSFCQRPYLCVTLDFLLDDRDVCFAQDVYKTFEQSDSIITRRVAAGLNPKHSHHFEHCISADSQMSCIQSPHAAAEPEFHHHQSGAFDCIRNLSRSGSSSSKLNAAR
jgi:hypothetical protein